MLTLVKEYTWNQCDLSCKAFIHLKYEIHGHSLEKCQAHEIISYPSLHWPFTMIEHMQYKSEKETILFKANKRDTKLFQFRVKQNLPILKNHNVKCKCVLLVLSKAPEVISLMFFIGLFSQFHCYIFALLIPTPQKKKKKP